MHAVVGVQQVGFSILLEGSDVGSAVVGLLLVHRPSEFPGLPVHHPDEEGVSEPVGVGGRPKQGVPLLHAGQEAGLVPLLPDGLVLRRQQGQQGLLVRGEGGGRGLVLTGHQPSAGQDQDTGQGQKQKGRALLFVLEDVTDALLGLSGRAGQGSGEEGMGKVVHDVPPVCGEKTAKILSVLK